MPWRPRYTALALLMAAFFSTMVARLVISPLVPDMIAAYDVSEGAIGFGLTGMWATYAVLQLPSGVLAERYGERAVVLLALLVTGVGGVVLSVASSYPLFLAAAFVLGVGTGLYMPAAASLLTRLFTGTGQALGFHISGGDLAGVVAPLAVAVIAARYGWQSALLVAPAVVLAVLALCAWRLPVRDSRSTGATGPKSVGFRALLGVVARPSIAYTIVLATALTFTFQAVVSFFPAFLVDHWSFSTEFASVVFAGLFLLWITFMPITGRLADAVGHDAVLAATTSCMVVGLALALTTASVPVALVGVGLLGVGMSWGGVVASRFMAHLPTAGRTAGYGMVRTAYMLLGASGSVVTGVVAETAGWPAAYGVVTALLVLALVAIASNRALGLGL